MNLQILTSVRDAKDHCRTSFLELSLTVADPSIGRKGLRKQQNQSQESEERRNGYDLLIKEKAKQRVDYRASLACNSEATFIEKSLLPAFQIALLKNENERLVYGLMDKPLKNGKKSDFFIGRKMRSHELYFFSVEVKRPDTSSKYQAEDDFTKLMKMMKDSVDEQLRLGIENPTSLGLLVEGMHIRGFQPLLLHFVSNETYADGIYKQTLHFGGRNQPAGDVTFDC
ncbi:unnamed protein product [Mucor hiemalis]